MSKEVESKLPFNQEASAFTAKSSQDCSMEEACGLGLISDPVPPGPVKDRIAREIPRPY